MQCDVYCALMRVLECIADQVEDNLFVEIRIHPALRMVVVLVTINDEFQVGPLDRGQEQTSKISSESANGHRSGRSTL